MLRLRGALIAIVLLTSATAFAQSDDGDNPGLITPTPKPKAAAEREGHLHQFGLGLQIAVGMRAINPYSDGVFCGSVGDNGNQNQAYCLARTPMTFDFELTYGVKPALEALMELRIGVERDFGTTSSSGGGPHVHQWAPGARFFFAETGRAKFFSTAQMVFDTSGYQDASGDDRGFDFGFRNVNGFWFDPTKAYGVYVFFGEEVGFKRWLSAALEGGVGVQGRLP
jgi:hypothetical protein